MLLRGCCDGACILLSLLQHFGQSVAVEIIPHCKVIHVDPLDEPLAIYKLRYRSRGILHASFSRKLNRHTSAALKAALILDEFEVISPDELLRRAREVLRNERRVRDHSSIHIQATS